MKRNEKEQIKALAMNSRFALICIIVLSGILTSCGISDQFSQARQISQFNFEFQKVEDVFLAGIPLVEGMKRNDLNAGQVMQLAGALFSSNLPLDFNIWVKISNPNNKNAYLNRMDYEVFLDGNKLITGNLDEPIFIQANDTSILKIPVEAELFKVLSGKSSEAVVNLGFRLTGKESREAEVEIRIKPYIKVGMKDLAYPGYISLKEKI
jgi:LEA14-like dessication related protein